MSPEPSRRAHPSKTIIRFWDDGKPLPALAARMEAWRRFNPGWRYQVYDRDSAAEYIGQGYGSAVREAFLDIRMPSMMSDVFRVARLLRGAGLWVDAGTICRAPLRSWLRRKDGLVMLRRPHMVPPQCWNGVIYAHRPGHPFLLALWETVERRLLARQCRRIWLDYGPGHFRDTLKAGDYDGIVRVIPIEELAGKVQVGTSIHFLPKETHWSRREKQGESAFLGGAGASSHHGA
ncbi:MAG: capsular polysaccharide synthesis protein [Cyanobacteria bacterium J06638_7]